MHSKQQHIYLASQTKLSQIYFKYRVKIVNANTTLTTFVIKEIVVHKQMFSIIFLIFASHVAKRVRMIRRQKEYNI